MSVNDDQRPNGHSVRFDETVYTDGDQSTEKIPDDNNELNARNRLNQQRFSRRSSILKRRINTITTSEAPRVILSDEGLKGGRVSPFTNFPFFLKMTVRSIGIVFGDIGTSPLYVVKTIFDSPPTEHDVIGAIALIVWSLIVVVSLKYAIFILMADNRGEGGPFALCSLLTGQTSFLRNRTKQFVSIISILSACLLIGDGALTPAVSILSAFEGMVVAEPSLSPWTVRISVIMIIILFLIQRWGSSRLGIFFGPIMILWFILLATIGIWRITFKPSILKAFNPWEALHYLIRTKKTGFYQIGSIFLSVTGLEALYADLGHFGRWPVRFSWFALVFPAVLLNYLGQGAVIIVDSTLIDNPFYHAVPDWGLWPLLVFSVIASTIASQAVITGSFSLVSQAVAMGYCVPFTVVHTSQSIISHIYIPAVNYFLLALTLAVTIGFQTSDNITDAYGVTVCSVMVITTILYMMVMRYSWSNPIWIVILFGIFLVIDLYTFAAICTTKIDSGGWVAIVIAVGLFIFSFSWYYGNNCLRLYLSENCTTNLIEDLPRRFGIQEFHQTDEENNDEEDHQSSTDDENDERRFPNRTNSNETSISIIENHFDSNIQEDSPIERTEICFTKGIGCFLSTSKKYTPYVFENFLRRMKASQEILIFLKLDYARIPLIDDDQRLIVRKFGQNIYHITTIFGYAETNVNLFNILHLARQFYDLPITEDQSTITFYLPNETIHVNTKGCKTYLTRWPLYIYSVLKNLYPGMPLNFTSIPENTIKIGILVDL
ncbi:unnamed protein product [Adineta ricciae]|uniref:Potassium transporter n=2 Tax=Adineta ricciae TaxID=249248 RepID=A0A815IKY6_ADIRI|nr:unnamed protein product [Adineta ricciae]